MRPHSLLLGLLPTFLLAACGSDAPSYPGTFELLDEPLAEERLQELGREVQVAVEAHLGVDLPDVPVRYCDGDELAELLVEELRPQLAVQLGEESADEAAEGMAEGMARMLIAKYAMAAGEVLFVEGRALEFADLIDVDELASVETLRALMVHELVHAYDAERIARLLDSCEDAGQLYAANAVLEGHAQFMARDICEANGWADGLTVYTDIITRLPASMDEASAYMGKIQASQLSFAYHEGEAFFEHVEGAGGLEAVAAVWEDPPREPILISEPAWYLDPELRAAESVDLVALLAPFIEAQRERGLTANELPMLRAQLEAAVSLLPADRTGPVLAHLVQARALVVADMDSAGSMLQGAVIELTGPAQAQDMLLLERELVEAKDASFSGEDSSARIVSVAYGEPESPGLVGFTAKKTVEVQPPVEDAEPMSIDVEALVVQRGSLVIELNALNGIDLDETLEELALRLLADVGPAD